MSCRRDYGNAGNNVLNGAGGARLLIGVGGTTLFITRRRTIIEAANEGRDVAYTVGSHAPARVSGGGRTNSPPARHSQSDGIALLRDLRQCRQQNPDGGGGADL